MKYNCELKFSDFLHVFYDNLELENHVWTTKEEIMQYKEIIDKVLKEGKYTYKDQEINFDFKKNNADYNGEIIKEVDMDIPNEEFYYFKDEENIEKYVRAKEKFVEVIEFDNNLLLDTDKSISHIMRKVFKDAAIVFKNEQQEKSKGGLEEPEL